MSDLKQGLCKRCHTDNRLLAEGPPKKPPRGLKTIRYGKTPKGDKPFQKVIDQCPERLPLAYHKLNQLCDRYKEQLKTQPWRYGLLVANATEWTLHPPPADVRRYILGKLSVFARKRYRYNALIQGKQLLPDRSGKQHHSYKKSVFGQMDRFKINPID